MALMGSTERRLKCLELAVKITRRMSKEDAVPAADEILAIAEQFDSWVYPPAVKK